jgi:hypothetical protein
MSKYGMPNMELPTQFSEMTDKAVAHARDIWVKAKVAGEEAANLRENAYGIVARRHRLQSQAYRFWPDQHSRCL